MMFLFSVRFPTLGDEMLLTLERHLSTVQRIRRRSGEAWLWARWESLLPLQEKLRYVERQFWVDVGH